MTTITVQRSPRHSAAEPAGSGVGGLHSDKVTPPIQEQGTNVVRLQDADRKWRPLVVMTTAIAPATKSRKTFLKIFLAPLFFFDTAGV